VAVLIGGTATSGGADFFGPGDAGGTRLAATASGDVAALTLNIGAGSTFTSLKVALYSDRPGTTPPSTAEPDTKLGEATITGTTAGNRTVSLPTPVTVVSGTQYWLMVLPLGGNLNFNGATGATGYKGTTGQSALAATFPATTFSDTGVNGGVPMDAETGSEAHSGSASGGVRFLVAPAGRKTASAGVAASLHMAAAAAGAKTGNAAGSATAKLTTTAAGGRFVGAPAAALVKLATTVTGGRVVGASANASVKLTPTVTGLKRGLAAASSLLRLSTQAAGSAAAPQAASGPASALLHLSPAVAGRKVATSGVAIAQLDVARGGQPRPGSRVRSARTTKRQHAPAVHHARSWARSRASRSPARSPASPRSSRAARARRSCGC
jgi:hypothetical protein